MTDLPHGEGGLAALHRKRLRGHASAASPLARRRSARLFWLALLAAGLILAFILSLMIGARPIPASVVAEALFAFDPTVTDHLVVHDMRLPRTSIGVTVGLCLAVAGALMQGVTRNPLADPGLLGVNSGASLAVVLAIWLLGITSMTQLLWFGFFGAGAVTVAVYALGSLGRGGATPVRLALAGTALNALLLALISAVLLISQETLDTYRFWMVGSIAGASADVLRQLGPFILVGLLAAVATAGALNAMALGDDMARALGTRLMRTRLMALAAITLLCGAAVSIAGPIVFLGLVVPHVARLWCGSDQRWMLAYCAFLGPIVLMASDILGRVILPPGEVQAGIITALLGGPLFVAIIRRIRLSQL